MFGFIQTMYGLRVDKELLDKARKEAKKLFIFTTEFVRRAIFKKMQSTGKFEKE